MSLFELVAVVDVYEDNEIGTDAAQMILQLKLIPVQQYRQLLVAGVEFESSYTVVYRPVYRISLPH